MFVKVLILFFAAFLFVANAASVADVVNEVGDDDDDDNVADGFDLRDLSNEDIQEIVQHVHENLKRAVDEMGSDQVEMVDDEQSLEKRFKTNWSLGRGWSVGTKGLNWQNRRRNMRFTIKPTFRGFRPSGFRAGFTWRF